MNLVMRKRALNALAKVKDTYEELSHLASIKVKHAICKDPSLAKYEYRCFTHKDKWVVAYKIKGQKFIVYRFIYGPWLDY